MTDQPTWREALQAAQQDVHEAKHNLQEAQRRRRDVAAKAYQAGLSYRTIGEGLGLSGTHVHHIIGSKDNHGRTSLDSSTPARPRQV